MIIFRQFGGNVEGRILATLSKRDYSGGELYTALCCGRGR
jgi:hypothetical protein